MRFSIITPTFKRADKLARAIASLQAQTYEDWEVIIVNDSPDDPSYIPFATSINDARIRYYANKTNSGVNFSRNFALDKISADSKWTLLLDDDDYFAPDTLQTFFELIQTHKGKSWFVTNRALVDGTPVTYAKKEDTTYSYIWDYLLLKRFRGDATHCIHTSALHSLRFSKIIKQGEEWLFFYQLDLKERMFYHGHNSTITEGYENTGLNFRKRSLARNFKDVAILLFEGISRGLWFHPTFYLYLIGRMIMVTIKSARKRT
jgi:glycosyltransferase involved in cell wall biosynthesis